MSGSKDADGSEATENTINQQHYIGSNERDNVKKKNNVKHFNDQLHDK